jgi:hypothetical protein
MLSVFPGINPGVIQIKAVPALQFKLIGRVLKVFIKRYPYQKVIPIFIIRGYSN